MLNWQLYLHPNPSPTSPHSPITVHTRPTLSLRITTFHLGPLFSRLILYKNVSENNFCWIHKEGSIDKVMRYKGPLVVQNELFGDFFRVEMVDLFWIVRFLQDFV